jgi:molybdenum cofactor cytidylyltransferase
MTEAVDCVMLAAGASSRMGRWKLALPWEGSTMLECCVRKALEVCHRVILVTGPHTEETQTAFSAAIRAGQVDLIHNPRSELGMFSSVQAGASRVSTDRFFLALGDMPGVEPQIYRLLLEYRAEAVIPKYQGKKGHPLLLSAAVARRIHECDSKRTLRMVLEEFPTLAVPVENAGILQDIDDPQEYTRFRGQEQS